MDGGRTASAASSQASSRSPPRKRHFEPDSEALSTHALTIQHHLMAGSLSSAPNTQRAIIDAGHRRHDSPAQPVVPPARSAVRHGGRPRFRGKREAQYIGVPSRVLTRYLTLRRTCLGEASLCPIWPSLPSWAVCTMDDARAYQAGVATHRFMVAGHLETALFFRRSEDFGHELACLKSLLVTWTAAAASTNTDIRILVSSSKGLLDCRPSPPWGLDGTTERRSARPLPKGGNIVKPTLSCPPTKASRQPPNHPAARNLDLAPRSTLISNRKPASSPPAPAITKESSLEGVKARSTSPRGCAGLSVAQER